MAILDDGHGCVQELWEPAPDSTTGLVSVLLGRKTTFENDQDKEIYKEGNQVRYECDDDRLVYRVFLGSDSDFCRLAD